MFPERSTRQNFNMSAIPEKLIGDASEGLSKFFLIMGVAFIDLVKFLATDRVFDDMKLDAGIIAAEKSVDTFRIEIITFKKKKKNELQENQKLRVKLSGIEASLARVQFFLDLTKKKKKRSIIAKKLDNEIGDLLTHINTEFQSILESRNNASPASWTDYEDSFDEHYKNRLQNYCKLHTTEEDDVDLV